MAHPLWLDSPFMKAARCEPTDYTPVWMMRQAGRYQAHYREIRKQGTFLDLCKSPDLAAEVMLRAVELLDVDAAIIFSDLLPILEPLGLELDFVSGHGPVIHNPIREASDVERIRELEDLQPLEFVFETVAKTRAGLDERLPLIGFAGAPFTLLAYAIEGGSSRNYTHTKRLMYTDSKAWNELMARLSRATVRYLLAQIDAGANAVQLFDSWVGCLDPDTYRRHVLPHTRSILTTMPEGVPVIHFATGNPALLSVLTEAGGTVMGIDWRIGLADAWKIVGYDRAVQGNLDPTILLTNPDEIRHHVQIVLNQAGGRPGHIFNLGHGILPETTEANARALVDAVHELSAKKN